MDALAVLGRLARQQLDEQRRALHAIDRALAAVRDELDGLRQQLEEERRAAATLADGERLLASYQRRILERERTLRAELDRLARERAAAAERLAEHRLETRRLEILVERRAERLRANNLKKRQKAADELALTRRHHRPPAG